MNCTERVARTKWCHRMPRIVSNKSNCIGSNCMAWRWTDKLTEGPDSYRAEPGPTGYCGLAGPAK